MSFASDMMRKQHPFINDEQPTREELITENAILKQRIAALIKVEQTTLPVISAVDCKRYNKVVAIERECLSCDHCKRILSLRTIDRFAKQYVDCSYEKEANDG